MNIYDSLTKFNRNLNFTKTKVTLHDLFCIDIIPDSFILSYQTIIKRLFPTYNLEGGAVRALQLILIGQ